MQKRWILVSGPLVSRDEDLVNNLKKTSLVLTNSDNRKIESILETNPVDAIILELSAAHFGDVEIIRNIKSAYKNIKIILIDGERELLAKAFQYGIKDAFRKPYRRDMLVERVNALLA